MAVLEYAGGCSELKLSLSLFEDVVPAIEIHNPCLKGGFPFVLCPSHLLDELHIAM